MTESLVALVVVGPGLAGLIAWFAAPARARRVATIGLLTAGAGGAVLAAEVFGTGRVRAFDGLVSVDAFSAYVLSLVLVVSVIALVGSRVHVVNGPMATAHPQEEPGRYYALLCWFAAGLAAVPLVDNLGLVWVGIEATTIVSALLVGFSRTGRAIEAAWKYLILGSIGVGFALFGTLLVYASSVGVLGETSDALAWTRLVEIAPQLDPAFVRLAFIFALAGYGTKAGLAPFHAWLPDAHSQAPSPISAMLSGAALMVSLYALARFHLVAAAALGPEFSSTLLVAVGLLSLVVALPFIVAQGDIKRLLAYSSIEHMGLATLALGFGGYLGLLGLALHLASHALTKATVFLAAGQLADARGSRRIGRLGGSLASSPAEGRALLLATLLLAGLPPSGIFVAELAIVFAGVSGGWVVPATIAAIVIALTAAGILFHVLRVTLGPWRSTAASGPEPDAPPARASIANRLLLGVPLAVVVIAGLWTPEPMAVVLDQVVKALGGGRG
jgi:hydrogenase-4 component F